MPLFEYICKECDRHFEALVMGASKPECPSCHSRKLEQQLSVFAARTSAGSSSAPSAAGPCGSCGHPDGPGSCRFDS